jgi:glc operon protein GlcG
MRRFVTLALVLSFTSFLATTDSVHAQQAVATATVTPAPTPPPPYGTPINLETALKAIAAAKVEADANAWPVCIVVVDTGGHVVALHRLDNTQIGSIEVATQKAKTAALFRRSTKVFEDIVAGGGAGLRILKLPGALPVEGGLPIIIEGKLIGAIGVSGVTSQQDAQIASAGIAALAK